ncbi:MAG: phosphotransferase [Firmicutes bacterium]|nr:phosphotransferase [Bacillota bacterium]
MKELKQQLAEEYGLDVQEMCPMSTGVGGDTFMVESLQGKFIYKIADMNEMNHPEAEPELCDFLRKRGLPVSIFLKNKRGEFITWQGQRICHVQKFLEGRTFGAHQAPPWLMEEMPVFLARVHRELREYKALPQGIGHDFFKFMTPERAKKSYLRSYEREDRPEIKEELEFRVHFLEKIANWTFDASRLTYCNSHGDYTIHQVICGDNKINGVIDWTSACAQPVLWEITRSFFGAEPSCMDGSFDEGKFNQYVKAYESIMPLNTYDRAQLLKVYIYQLAVCDYYSQYLSVEGAKKEEYLQQARFGTKILKNCGIV